MHGQKRGVHGGQHGLHARERLVHMQPVGSGWSSCYPHLLLAHLLRIAVVARGEVGGGDCRAALQTRISLNLLGTNERRGGGSHAHQPSLEDAVAV